MIVSSERREPHLPVQSRLVRSDPRRRDPHVVRRFVLELDRGPVPAVVGSLEDDLRSHHRAVVADARHATEQPVAGAEAELGRTRVDDVVPAGPERRQRRLDAARGKAELPEDAHPGTLRHHLVKGFEDDTEHRRSRDQGETGSRDPNKSNRPRARSPHPVVAVRDAAGGQDEHPSVTNEARNDKREPRVRLGHANLQRDLRSVNLEHHQRVCRGEGDE